MNLLLRAFAAACGALACAAPLAAPSSTAPAPLAAAERAFLDYLDATGAVGFIESGLVASHDGADLSAWQRRLDEARAALRTELAVVEAAGLPAGEAAAFAAMRRTLAEYEGGDSTDGARSQACADAGQAGLDFEALRTALLSCFYEHGNRLRFEGREITRGTALQLLHVIDEPARRKAVFDAFGPLWTALNGRNEPGSPYRRLVALAAAEPGGTQVQAAARAIGVDVATVERWLVQVLEAWRDASPDQWVEPWDYRWRNSAANRALQARIPAEALLPVNQRYYRDLGADLTELGVVFDLAPRPDKSPLAYSDFLRRGRDHAGQWRRPVARVLGNYPEGGLFSLNELVHENGHAVHVSAIRTRPAYMDWPDTLFTEAFADVPAWSVHEPAWQLRYLGAAADEAESLRSLHGNTMLDVAWSLFELRLLRDPATDPNALWTEITSRYLRIRPHPEVPWWAMRVQLAGNPGYMIHYGLGAVLTAEMRAAASARIGAFDTGNPAWYGWFSEQLLRHGSERDTRTLTTALLGRPVAPDALLAELRRMRPPR